MILEILDSATVEVRVGDNSEVTLCCPFCVEKGETADARFRLGINTEKGLAHCYNCNWASRDREYIARELCRVFHLPFRGFKRAVTKVKKVKQEKATVLGLPIEYESFRPPLDLVGRAVRDYLTGRGVSTLQLVKHKIGFAGAGDMSWRALFPVIDEGRRFQGCVGRAVKRGVKPKYLNTPGIKHLWNARPGGTAVVVEGVMDALHVESALFQVRDTVAVARLGSAITSTQMDQLKQYSRVVVFPDRDHAGVKGVEELCVRCHDRGINTSVIVPEKMDGRDPGDMTETEIVSELNGAQVWSRKVQWELELCAARKTPVFA